MYFLIEKPTEKSSWWQPEIWRESFPQFSHRFGCFWPVGRIDGISTTNDSVMLDNLRTLEGFSLGANKKNTYQWGAPKNLYLRSLDTMIVCIYIYVYPGGGFKYVLFPPLPGEDSHFD